MTAPGTTVLHAADEAQTLALGRRLGAAAGKSVRGLTVWLEGGLGAGKTTLTRGWLAGMGYAGRVKSPTYTLLEPYVLPNGIALAHLDLYRLADPEELEFLGLRELAGPAHWLLVEWPEKGAGHLPPADVEIAVAFTRDAGRQVKITTNTDAAAQWFALI